MLVCAKANSVAAAALAGGLIYAGCASQSQSTPPPGTAAAASGSAEVVAAGPNASEQPGAAPEAEAPNGMPPATGANGRPRGDTRTTEAIAGVIKLNRDQARACYEKVQKDVPNLRGDVVIHFVLSPDGTVKTASLNEQRSTLKEPAVSNCIIDVIRDLKFPDSSRGMETAVNYPFNFVP